MKPILLFKANSISTNPILWSIRTVTSFPEKAFIIFLFQLTEILLMTNLRNLYKKKKQIQLRPIRKDATN